MTSYRGGSSNALLLREQIVIEPDVLLLDEPLSNLDAKLREETRMQIRELQRAANTTAIYVPHDQAEAMSMSDRIAVLADGRAHQIGTPQEVYRRPATAFVARFIGRSNVVRARVVSLTDGAAEVTFGGANLTVDRDPSSSVEIGQERDVSLRPESLALVSEDSAQLRGVVKTVEYLGSSAMLAVDVDGPLVMVLTPRIDVEPDQRVGIALTDGGGWLIPE